MTAHHWAESGSELYVKHRKAASSARSVSLGRGHKTSRDTSPKLLLKIRQELGMERAAFVTSHGAFDTHTNLGEVLDWNMGVWTPGAAR